MHKNILYKAVIWQLIAIVIFSFHYIAAQKLLKSVDSFALITLRGVLGGFVVFAIQFILYPRTLKSTESITIKKLFVILLMILFGFVLNQFLFIHGIQKTNASIAALWSNTLPLVVYGMSLIFGLEKWSKIKGSLLILSFFAIFGYFFLKFGQNVIFGQDGSFLVFLAFLCLGFFLTLSKLQLVFLHPAVITAAVLFFGGATVGLLAKPDLNKALEICFSSAEFAWLFIFEVVVTALAWFLNFKAIAVLGAAKASVLNFLQIPLSAVFAFYYFQEIPPLSLILLSAWLLPVVWFLIRQRSDICLSNSDVLK